MIYRKAFAVGICIVKQWKERLGEQYMNTSQAEGIDQLQGGSMKVNVLCFLAVPESQPKAASRIFAV